MVIYNKVSPNATVQIKSNTKWSGSIMDSGFDSATRDGYGDTDQKVGISAGNYRFSHIAFGCHIATPIQHSLGQI